MHDQNETGEMRQRAREALAKISHRPGVELDKLLELYIEHREEAYSIENISITTNPTG